MNTKDKITPFIETHPGEILFDELQARKITQSSFSKETGIAQTMLNEIIKGKRSITADLALIFEKTLDISANYWLNLQNNYELDKAKLKEKNIQKIETLEFWKILKQYIPINVFKRLNVLTGYPEKDIPIIKLIYKFTNIDELINQIAIRMSPSYYKRSEKLKINEINLLGWSKLAIYQAATITVRKFDSNCKYELLNSLKIIFKNNTNTVYQLKNCLSDFGIKFNIIEKFEHTPIDGFSFWSGDNPSITITLRQKKLDNLIFTIFHELGHIFLHLINNKSDEYLDLENTYNVSVEEEQANEFAKNNLIPINYWTNFLIANPKITDTAMINFANNLKIHPSVILGRYCFETKNYAIKTNIDRIIR